MSEVKGGRDENNNEEGQETRKLKFQERGKLGKTRSKTTL